MHEILKRHHISFVNAFSGLKWAVQTQPNFRIHLVLSIAALGFGLFLSVPRTEMAILLFTVLLGLSAEMINTSIEAMTDMITSQWRMEAKIAKDVAAGMMLLVAMGALAVACFIFIPHIYQLIIYSQ